MLVLYVTLLGAAVGVRDAGHIGMESLLVLLPERVRLQARDRDPRAGRRSFGALMACNGCAARRSSVMDYKIPTLGISEGSTTCRWSIAGVLIVLFSIEHIIALLRGDEVEPAWH